jgi:phosphoglycerate dehydrogenase-like enzyme
MKPKVLMIDEMTKKAKARLEPFVEFIYPEDGNDYSNDFAAIYTGLSPVVTNAPVFTPCTGTDHIISPKIIYLDRVFKDTVGKEITSTAEHTLSLMLQIAKQNKMQLKGKKIGIIGGAGRIGKMLTRYCVALDMEVYIYDIDPCMDVDTKLRGGAIVRTLADLDKMLPICDIISINIPLNNDTRNFVNGKMIEKMKTGILLVNTSRWQVVNEEDVITALKLGKLGGYAHDFKSDMYDESSRHNMWFDADMVNELVETPHIAGNCTEAREITDMYIADKMLAYLGIRI